jgi:hypothetical protein
MSKPTNSNEKPATEEVAKLRLAIEALMDYLESLTQSIDNLTIELQWQNRQTSDDRYSPTTPILTSMPLDPTARDWQINRLTPDDLPPETPPVRETRRQTLFD